MAYERRDYSGARAETAVSGDINNSVTTITVASGAGWPDGTNGPFFAVIDPGTASEEKILVASRTGTTLNSVTRGVDDTAATAHTSGAVIYPCFTATDADEANYWVAELAGAANAADDLIIADGSNSLSRIAKGANSTVLAVNAGGTLGYTTVTSAMIADGSIGSADVANGAITLEKLASAVVGLMFATGDYLLSARSSTPTGFLPCDGSAVSRTTYSALFAVIGTTFGVGDGSTTFNLPDYRERFPVGTSGSLPLGATGGASSVTLTTAQMPSHTHVQDAHTHVQDAHTHTQNAHTHTQNSHNHGVTDPGHTHTTGLAVFGSGFIAFTGGSEGTVGITGSNATGISVNSTTATNQNTTATNQSTTATNQNTTATNQNTGGGGAHENRPPYLATHVYIKF